MMPEEFCPKLNRPSYQGSNASLDPERCKAGVWSKDRWSTYSQCSKKPHKDGWCKIHHPDAEAARNAASNAKHEADRRKRVMGWYGERFMAALIKIRDGDNDPRETARIALEGCSYATGGDDGTV
jgi:hypothetical protein